MGYAYLADAVVTVHVAYVAFVILGQLLIVAGVLLKWGWVRNMWFRLAHLAAIVLVAAEALTGIECPLTSWEDELRRRAGQEVTDGTFIGRFMHDILYNDLPAAHTADGAFLTTCYVGFALLVFVTFVLAPPRRTSKGVGSAGRTGVAATVRTADPTTARLS